MFFPIISMTPPQNDRLLRVVVCCLGRSVVQWRSGRYSPTPTIMEAALVLYRSHSVADISRSDASG